MSIKYCDDCGKGQIKFLARRLKEKDDKVLKVCEPCGRKLAKKGYIIVTY